MEKREVFRALPLGYEVRDDGEGMPTLVGHAAVFNQWTEIQSRSEGHFLERIAPSAFAKTISENRDRMRVLFQHGHDPAIGEKPLGPIASLETDETGLRYEVPLLDTSYNRDIVEMLRAEPPVLGSSFRFEVIREDRARNTKKSSYNPRALPERTVQEVRMSEFGPVTFPAYIGAGAGLRSLTDRMVFGEETERVDSEDLSYLAQMLQLGTCYIEDQDEPGDEVNIPVMEGILQQLAGLVTVEAAEDEPVEPEDEAEMASDTPVAPSPDGAANGHAASGRRESLYGMKRKGNERWRL